MSDSIPTDFSPALSVISSQRLSGALFITCAFVCALFCTLFCTLSTAEASGGFSLHPDGFWAPVGFNVGYSIGEKHSGAILGAEISLPYVNNDLFWAGPFMEVSYHTGIEDLRVLAGAELGWAIIGIDAAVIFSDHGRGYRGRLVVPLLFIAPYVGGGEMSTASGQSEAFFDVGILLKFPIPVTASL